MADLQNEGKKMKMKREDKVLFPKDKITKKDIGLYFSKVALRMIPLIKNHPLVMERYPDGIQSSGFYQKNVPTHFPDWIKKVTVSRKEKGRGKLILCQNKKTLLFLADQACLTPHIWLSKAGELEKPDRMIFDLDPPKGKVDLARKTALLLKGALEKMKLKPFLMTTGSKGYHVVVPIKPKHSFEEVKAFAKEIASRLSDENPKICTVEIRKNKRKGRVFIDTLRNEYAQHAVCPYAMRAKDGASIAMPISWSQLSKVEPDHFKVKGFVLQKVNPWADFFKNAKNLPKKS